ncbi:MAG: DNA gyrase subunit A [Gilliamella sp.]|nr:DNA gyrase subunit A [Gilliamella sp.]
MMLITDAGTLVRTRVSEVSIVGRNTQGVMLIRTADNEKVVGLQRIAETEDDASGSEVSENNERHDSLQVSED